MVFEFAAPVPPSCVALQVVCAARPDYGTVQVECRAPGAFKNVRLLHAAVCSRLEQCTS